MWPYNLLHQLINKPYQINIHHIDVMGGVEAYPHPLPKGKGVNKGMGREDAPCGSVDRFAALHLRIGLRP